MVAAFSPDMALAEYLRAWLEEQRSQLQPQTWQAYHDIVERYLVPALGEVALSPRWPRASSPRCMPRCRTATAGQDGG